jgi:hypothetical protein
MTDQPKRRGGWPGPRKAAWAFKPDPDAVTAVTRYMEAHGLKRERRGDLTKALNAMLATHPAARTAKPTQGAAVSYQGEVIATIEGVNLRRLTAAEQLQAGRVWYSLDGETHWNPIHFFLKQAEDHERSARLLRAAYAELVARTAKPDTEETP